VPGAQLRGRGELFLIHNGDQVVRAHIDHDRRAVHHADEEIRYMLTPTAVRRVERQTKRPRSHRGDLWIEVQQDEMVTLTP
jgi:hypothetical protein